MGKITTDFTGAENATTRLARLQAIHDYWFGAGAFEDAGTLGAVRAQMNGIMTDTVADGEAFATWLAKWNDANDPDTWLSDMSGLVGYFTTFASGKLFQDTGAATAADDPAEAVGRINPTDDAAFQLLQASAGLRPIVVKHPVTGVRNLINRTVDMSGSYLGGGAALSVNSVVAPDGTTTAHAYTWPSSTVSYGVLTFDCVSQSLQAHTCSVWMKKPVGTGSSTVRLLISDLDVSTGIGPDVTVTEEWQRFTFTRASLSETGKVGFGLNLLSGLTAGQVLHVWGPQLERGSVATPYQAVGATSADVTEAGVASVTGIRMDQTTQKLGFTVPGSGSFTGTMILAGAGGTWAETVTLTRGTAYDLGPLTVAGSSVGSGLIAAVQGPLAEPNNKLLGFLLFDRVLTDGEIRRIARRFKAVGGKGWLRPGPELVSNGDFSNADLSMWPSSVSFPATRAIVSGELQVTSTGDFGRVTQPIEEIDVGDIVLAEATFRRISGTGISYPPIGFGSDGDNLVLPGWTTTSATPATLKAMFVSTSDDVRMSLANGSTGAVGGFDNISLRIYTPEF